MISALARIKHPLWVYSIISVLFLFVCTFFWNDLPMSESVHFLEMSETFDKATKVDWHPPLYSILLSLFYMVFAGKFLGGYLLGIFSVLLSGWCIYLIIKVHETDIDQSPLILGIILASYYSLPVIIHGSFILDIDNTVFTPALLFSYLSYLRFQKNPGWKPGMVLLVMFTLSLWFKMTTPMILMCAICFFHLITLDFRFLFLKLIPVCAGAFVLFYSSYGWLYTQFVLNGYGSFQYNSGKTRLLLSGQNTFQLSIRDLLFSVSSNLGALVAWSSPILFLIFAVLIWQIWREKRFQSSIAVPLIFILASIFGYTFLLKIQVSAGFPKYHYPSFAFLFVMIGILLLRSRFQPGKFDLLFFLGCYFFYTLVLGDLLFEFYRLGREQQLVQLVVYFVKSMGFILLPIVLYILIKKTILSSQPINILFILLGFLVVMNLSGFSVRSQADYSTNYHYGIKGTHEALAYAKKIPINQSVYLPFVGFFLERPGPTKTASMGRLLGRKLSKPTTDYIIITDTMLNRNKFFFRKDQVIGKYERIKTIQSYGVWKKKQE